MDTGQKIYCGAGTGSVGQHSSFPPAQLSQIAQAVSVEYHTACRQNLIHSQNVALNICMVEPAGRVAIMFACLTYRSLRM